MARLITQKEPPKQVDPIEEKLAKVKERMIAIYERLQITQGGKWQA